MNATLVLGTTNQGKVRELLELLEPFGMVCASLTGLVGAVDVAETGSTFAENAALKAQAQARRSADTGEWILPSLAEQGTGGAGMVGVTASTGLVR